MPILSPDAVVPLLAIDLLELSAMELLLLISVLLQPIRMAAQRIEKIRRDVLNIGFLLLQFSTRRTESRIKGLKSAGMIHEKMRIREALGRRLTFRRIIAM